MTDSADRWDHLPMFSASDKGVRITWLAPGRQPGTITTGLLVSALLGIAAWGALSSLTSSWLCTGTSMPQSRCSVGVSNGWIPLLVVAVLLVAIRIAVDLGERAQEQFGQRRAGGLLWSTVVLLGIAVGGLASVVRQLGPDPSETWRRTFDFEIGTESLFISGFVALVAAIWGLVNVIRLPPALRRARARQATIERLRHEGTRYVGSLQLGKVIYWLGSHPELAVTVTYEGLRQVSARMRTSPDRVPVEGSSVLVFTEGGGGAVHLELDTSVETVFEPEERYTASDG